MNQRSTLIFVILFSLLSCVVLVVLLKHSSILNYQTQADFTRTSSSCNIAKTIAFSISQEQEISIANSQKSGESSSDDRNVLDSDLLAMAVNSIGKDYSKDVFNMLLQVDTTKLRKTPIIFTMVSDFYLGQFNHLWLPSVLKANRNLLEQIVVLGTSFVCSQLNLQNVTCLSSKKFEAITENKTNVNVDRPKIWGLRVGLICALLATGNDILMSDLDAIFIKDPFPTLLTNEDLVFSCGFGPKHTANDKNWPEFSLCCGFGLIRSTKDTRRFVRIWLKSCSKGSCDDQTTLNLALKKLGIKWKIGKMEMRKNFTLSDVGEINKNDIKMNVKLISFGDVVRGKPTKSTPNPFVIHD